MVGEPEPEAVLGAAAIDSVVTGVLGTGSGAKGGVVLDAASATGTGGVGGEDALLAEVALPVLPLAARTVIKAAESNWWEREGESKDSERVLPGTLGGERKGVGGDGGRGD